MKKRILFAFVLIFGVMLLAGCAAGGNPTVDVPDAEGKSAGFWMGLWHGVISPVTFVISLFSDNVSIYEVYNSGNWYDFGFMLGLSVILGGGVGGAKKKR